MLVGATLATVVVAYLCSCRVGILFVRIFIPMKSDFRRGRCANTQDGFTVLHSAAYRGSKEVVEFLVHNGADVGRTNKVMGMNTMRVANCSCYIDLTNS